MLFPLVLFLFVGTSKSSFPGYKPFSPIQQLSEIENSLDPIEMSSRRGLHTNKILECDMRDLFETVGFNELQDLIEALAVRKLTSPFAVLKVLHRRMKSKEELEESIMNAMDGVPIPEVMNPPNLEVPPPVRLPPSPGRAPYSLSVPNSPTETDDTKVVIVPVAPPMPAQNSFASKLPASTKTDRHEAPFMIPNGGPPVGKINHVIPAVFPMLSPLRSNHFRPPLGATIRVNSGDPRNPINRDIIIPISPLMTILEALRQAETRYQNILGLSHDMDVISFSHSSEMGCYMVNNIGDVESSGVLTWKILITDREGHVVYDNFCLPNGKEVLVKPGTTISLSYVPL
ncbi:hypothetical protein JTE90_029177 [Oedothorax gibbosus]|uniref:Uncharacterized protein n=1 Tax=Oedothorax gibbosus TaxID=931172 RepID=A0AAV6VFR0_9ARAC|nr:hypothetical protein JTE90_029177 [Oedothorax gibbosus]